MIKYEDDERLEADVRWLEEVVVVDVDRRGKGSLLGLSRATEGRRAAGVVVSVGL